MSERIERGGKLITVQQLADLLGRAERREQIYRALYLSADQARGYLMDRMRELLDELEEPEEEA